MRKANHRNLESELDKCSLKPMDEHCKMQMEEYPQKNLGAYRVKHVE